MMTVTPTPTEEEQDAEAMKGVDADVEGNDDGRDSMGRLPPKRNQNTKHENHYIATRAGKLSIKMENICN